MNRIKITAVALFLLILIIPALYINCTEQVFSEREGRLLTVFPKLLDETGHFNRNFGSEFDVWLDDHIGFRDELILANNSLQYYVFQTSDESIVSVGKNGWLFTRNDHDMEVVAGEYILGEKQFEQIADGYEQMQKALNALGAELVLVITPSKGSIYPEYMKGDYQVTYTMADAITDYIQENTDLHIINLKERFLAEKESSDNLLYMKTDTHWNQYGAYIGYCQVMEQLRSWGITQEQPVSVSFEEDSYDGDMLSRMMGDLAEPETVPVFCVQNSLYQVTKDSADKTLLDYSETHSNLRTEHYVAQDNGDRKSLLLLGDSFSSEITEKWAFLFSNSFSETTFIWRYYVDEQFLLAMKPDVVVVEITERCIPIVLDHFIDISWDSNSVYYSFPAIYDCEQLKIAVWNEASNRNDWLGLMSGAQEDLVWYEPERLLSSWSLKVPRSLHQYSGYFRADVYSVQETKMELLSAQRFVIP